jgi:hypothetical protein
MESGGDSSITRRSFMGSAAVAGSAAPAFTIVKPEQMRGVDREMLRLGILGVGMRGSQAVLDTWAGNENVQLVAIGELFKDRLDGGIANLKQKAPQQFERKFKVDPDRMFIGFDAYKKVLAADIDVLMICTRRRITRCISSPRWKPGSTSFARSPSAPIRSMYASSWTPPGKRRS